MRRAGSDDRERELLGEMAGKRRLRGDEGFEIVVAVVAAAGAGRRPIPNRPAGSAIVARRAPCRPGRPGHRRDRAWRDRPAASGLAARGLRPLGQLAPSLGASPGACARLALAFAGAVEQRIALELVLHIGHEVEIGELQQLDGLHQLRRHHQRVALPDFKSLGERHGALGRALRRTGPILAYPVRRAHVHQFVATVVNVNLAMAHRRGRRLQALRRGRDQLPVAIAPRSRRWRGRLSSRWRRYQLSVAVPPRPTRRGRRAARKHRRRGEQRHRQGRSLLIFRRWQSEFARKAAFSKAASRP